MYFDIKEDKKGHYATYNDENGFSIIYRGSLRRCRDYINSQKRKLIKGKLVHISKTVGDRK